ncbi:hypothetical protein B0H16DRAFT_1746990 [Mycena metata]|uniref:Uncharacterized protein n=1 Tax=Mycena metata TaxID=1033252 RepID=A0AAD7GUX7_9AGAR|nr:hypothetical protein B0H16DRAFT_1746990 [Mycena metata]
MPKVTKSASPAKSRPKPRPIRSPKKVAEKLVDEEAQESDDGVRVDRADFEVDGYQTDTDPVALATNSDLNGYNTDFINDGDPFDDHVDDFDGEQEQQVTPPSSPSKQVRGRGATKTAKQIGGTPPSSVTRPTKGRTGVSDSVGASAKRKAKPTEDLIEVDTTSEEDMEVMDEDDSMFKKPPLLKRSALPPSLTTRSAASKVAATNVGTPSKRTSATSKSAIANQDVGESGLTLSELPASLRGPPFVVDGKMTEYVDSLFLDAFNPYIAYPIGTIGSDGGDIDDEHIDHDQIALEAGIRSSLGIAKPANRPSSPDWDPPYAGDVVEEVFKTPVKKVKSELVSSPSKRRADPDNVETDSDIGSELKPSPPKRAKPSAGTARPATRSSKKKETVSSDEEGDIVADIECTRNRKGKGKAVQDSPASPSKHKYSDTSKSPRKVPDSTVASYMVDKAKPVVSASAGTKTGGPPLTMAQLLRVNRGEPVGDADTDAKETTPPIVADPVFLEDIESYKAYFDPDAPCGVFDIELQDVSLRPHYIGLPPLPKNKRVIPAYDRLRNSLDDIDWTTGGRVKFSSWFDQNPRMLAAYVQLYQRPSSC